MSNLDRTVHEVDAENDIENHEMVVLLEVVAAIVLVVVLVVLIANRLTIDSVVACVREEPEDHIVIKNEQ